MVNLVAMLNTELDHAFDELVKLGWSLRNCVLSARSTAIRRMVPLPLLGLSTLTARRPMVIMLMAPLTAEPV
jgi:hypothetical protein